MQKRIAEICSPFQKLYEDNASGRITDERYETLSSAYEKEQAGLREKVPELTRRSAGKAQAWSNLSRRSSGLRA